MVSAAVLACFPVTVFACERFFVCASASGSLASTVIGAGTAAILRMPGLTPVPGVYAIAGISFLLGAGLSYVFLRLFTKRLVSRVQAQRAVFAN